MKDWVSNTKEKHQTIKPDVFLQGSQSKSVRLFCGKRQKQRLMCGVVIYNPHSFITLPLTLFVVAYLRRDSSLLTQADNIKYNTKSSNLSN